MQPAHTTPPRSWRAGKHLDHGIARPAADNQFISGSAPTAAAAGPLVLVHHPGSSHLPYNLVASLQRLGWDCMFETGYFYREHALSSRLARRLPGTIGARVTRQLKRRHHPGVDAGRLRLRPFAELVYIGARQFGQGGMRLESVMTWRNEHFDAAVARQVRRLRPNVVVGHSGATLLAGRAAHNVGALTILNQDNAHVESWIKIQRAEVTLAPEFDEPQLAVPERLSDRAKREIAESDHVLVPSEFVRDSLMEHGADPSRISILPYGVDIDQFHPSPRLGDDGLRILFVGHVGLLKGVRYLLEAVRRLAIADITVTMIGRMTCDPAALEPWRGLFNHIPHVPFQEVPALYREADVFVFPSLVEGSAFVTYEALASGLPVITTPNAGSVVRDDQDGIIVPIRDVDALMLAIERLYKDPELRRSMARNARARAEEFSWSNYGNRLAALLTTWLAERGNTDL